MFEGTIYSKSHLFLTDIFADSFNYYSYELKSPSIQISKKLNPNSITGLLTMLAQTSSIVDCNNTKI